MQDGLGSARGPPTAPATNRPLATLAPTRARTTYTPGGRGDVSSTNECSPEPLAPEVSPATSPASGVEDAHPDVGLWRRQREPHPRRARGRVRLHRQARARGLGGRGLFGHRQRLRRPPHAAVRRGVQPAVAAHRHRPRPVAAPPAPRKRDRLPRPPSVSRPVDLARIRTASEIVRRRVDGPVGSYREVGLVARGEPRPQHSLLRHIGPVLRGPHSVHAAHKVPYPCQHRAPVGVRGVRRYGEAVDPPVERLP